MPLRIRRVILFPKVVHESVTQFLSQRVASVKYLMQVQYSAQDTTKYEY